VLSLSLLAVFSAGSADAGKPSPKVMNRLIREYMKKKSGRADFFPLYDPADRVNRLRIFISVTPDVKNNEVLPWAQNCLVTGHESSWIYSGCRRMNMRLSAVAG